VAQSVSFAADTGSGSLSKCMCRAIVAMAYDDRARHGDPPCRNQISPARWTQ
jgi:hypothetical protein